MQLRKTMKCLTAGLLAIMLVISLLGGAMPVTAATTSSEKALTSMTLSHSVEGVIDEENKTVSFEFPSDHPIDGFFPIKFSHTGVSASISGIELTSPTALLTNSVMNSSIVITAEDGSTASYSIIITQLPSDGSPQIVGIVVDPNPIWVVEGSTTMAKVYAVYDNGDRVDVTTDTIYPDSLIAATIDKGLITGLIANYAMSFPVSYWGHATMMAIQVSEPPTPSITILTSSLNPSEEGQEVTFTATVPGAAGRFPNGTIKFMDGDNMLTIVPLEYMSSSLEMGATFTTNQLSAGEHTITAVYNGNDYFTPSTSEPLTQTVNVASVSTTTTLTSSANPSIQGQEVTFTADVSAAEEVGSPTGTVTFMNGDVVLGTSPVDASGLAAFATSSLIAGSHSITAIYSGDSEFKASTSAPLSQTVHAVVVIPEKTTTTTTLTSSVNPSFQGQKVTFTADVSAAGDVGSPTGTVTFMNGDVVLGTSPVDASGLAAFATSSLIAGSHSITAIYSGDSEFKASTSSPLSQTVHVVIVIPEKTTTTTTLTSSANPSIQGQEVTFTADVTAAEEVRSPSGTVTFMNGDVLLGTSPVDASGLATFVTSSLIAGSHSITAAYSGDSEFKASTSTPLSQTVHAVVVIPEKTTTTTTVTSSLNPSFEGQEVTFTADVTAAEEVGLPTGTVTFMNGDVLLGTSPVDASGLATFVTSSLIAGSHSITAAYSGDSEFKASTSTPLSQTVHAVVVIPEKTTTTTTVTSSANPSTKGQEVTFNAVVSGADAGSPTGTVTFMNGDVVLGTSPVDASGLAAFATSSLIAGSHSITAAYSGDSEFKASTSTPLSQTVKAASSGSGSSNGGSGPVPADVTEEITVEVETGSVNNGSVVSLTPITRTREANGKVKDNVTFTTDSAQKAIDAVKKSAGSTTRIVIPDTKDEVSQVDVNIAAQVMNQLDQSDLDLELYTENVRIQVPRNSLNGFVDDLYFRLVPIKDEDGRKEVEERARVEELVQAAAQGQSVDVVARPMTIETNMQSRPVSLILPLRDVKLPEDAKEREQFLADLIIFVEHSDGDKQLVHPTVVEYKDGLLGLQFDIQKFSTFTILNMEGWRDQHHSAYMKGFPDQTFRPDANITRAQMAAILARNLGLKEDSGTMSAYPDVAATHWATGAIAFVKEKGLMVGDNAGNFNTEAPITRAEIATIVARYINSELPELKLSSFNDIEVGHWAAPAIEAAYRAGMIEGYQDGTYRASNLLSRAEGVTIINRLFNRGPLIGTGGLSWSDVPSTHWALADIEEASRDHYYVKDSSGNESIISSSNQ